MWTGAVRRLRGCEDHKGHYEAVEQQHAAVQMVAVEGLSALRSPATDQQDHHHLQVDYLAKPAQLPCCMRMCMCMCMCRGLPHWLHLGYRSTSCLAAPTPACSVHRITGCGEHLKFITGDCLDSRHLPAIAHSPDLCRSLARPGTRMSTWLLSGSEL